MTVIKALLETLIFTQIGSVGARDVPFPYETTCTSFDNHYSDCMSFDNDSHVINLVKFGVCFIHYR